MDQAQAGREPMDERAMDNDDMVAEAEERLLARSSGGLEDPEEVPSDGASAPADLEFYDHHEGEGDEDVAGPDSADGSVDDVDEVPEAAYVHDTDQGGAS